MSKRLRIAQCYTGGVGSDIVRRLAAHPHLDLVGVLVHSEAKAGLDAGEVVGIPPVGVVTTLDLEEIIALKPDGAIWSGLGYQPDQLARLLRAGINVYTGLGGYFLAGHEDEELLESACQQGQSSFAAGGNIPGLISDVFPLFLSGYTGDVKHIAATQRNHVAHYPSAEQLTGGLGLGKPMEATAPDDIAFEAYLDEQWEILIGMSAAMVAAGLGIPFSQLRTRVKEKQPAPRTETLPGSGLVIDAGSVGGVRWTWDAYSGDQQFLTVVNEQTGVYGLGPDWRQDEAQPAWTVDIDGSPPIRATFTWPEGTPAAAATAQLNAARAVNYIAALVAAEPGCLSVLDLPMITTTDVRG